MKKIPFLLIAMMCTLLFACKHEVPEKQPEPINPQPADTTQTSNMDPEPTDTSQISKSVLGTTLLTSGTDVTSLNYQYDAQHRLAWYANTSTKKDYISDTSRLIRDDNGMIKQIVYRSKASGKFPDPKLDSVVYTVSHNAGNTQYTYKILAYKSYGVPFKDSAAYTYDAQNRILKEEAYFFDYNNTKTYVLYAKTDLDYDNNSNVTSLKVIYYKVDGVNDYPYEITYTYEQKGVNLLNLGNEAVVLGLQQHFSAHPPKTMISTYPLNPEYNRSLTYTYTYNTKYRPLRAEITDAITGTKSTMVYSYQ